MKNVTSSTFKKEVLSSKKAVLVDYHADWCGPCHAVAPLLEKLAEEFNLKLVKVDVDTETDLAKDANILSIPNIQLVEKGEVKKVVVGAKPYSVLVQELGLSK